MGNTLATCSINVIDAAELIYDHLYADDDITIGQLYEANNYRIFVAMLFESAMGKVPLIQVCRKKPGKSKNMLEVVLESLLELKVYAAECSLLISLIQDLISQLSRSSFSDQLSDPSSRHLKIA